MKKPLRVLIVEDSEDDALFLAQELKHGDFDLTLERVETPEAMNAALDHQTWDLVISDYAMPHFSVLSALNLLRERGLDLPFIIVSGQIIEDVAVAAMRAGAHDYIMKGNLTRLVPAVERELREAEVRRERRRAEEQLRQAQKMEAIGKLAGGIAHDFNNLLTSILSYGQLSLSQISEDNPLRKNIEEMVKAGERAATLTRQILAFSRRQIVEPRVLDLNTIVTDMDNMLSRLIGEDIELVTVMGPELGHVKTDPGQIQQIIMNLVVNAQDAMPQGGRLTIETANVNLDEISICTNEDVVPGRYVKLSVSDTGEGMNSEVISQIFEPFFTTKEQGKGTGLGLSTVYGIVKQNNGHICVESKIGHGTTFEIFLDRVEEPVETVVPQSRLPQPSHGSDTILVVEDEDAVRELICKVLQAQGYTVLKAPHGDEALLIVERHKGPIQLMVTDVVMPRMSGRELVQRLEPRYPEMRVLYISGYTENEIVHNSVLDEDTAFLQKPFMPDILVRKVREVLDVHRS